MSPTNVISLFNFLSLFSSSVPVPRAFPLPLNELPPLSYKYSLLFSMHRCRSIDIRHVLYRHPLGERTAVPPPMYYTFPRCRRARCSQYFPCNKSRASAACVLPCTVSERNRSARDHGFEVLWIYHIIRWRE